MNTTPAYTRRWHVLGAMCLVLFIVAIDDTVLNLALPSISAKLHASASELQWVVDAYILVFASVLITTGTMGDRYGRKRILTYGLVLFGLGSLFAALSSSIFMLIGFRGLLGLAGAMVMPSTLSILTDVFRDRKERARAIAIWSSVFAIGAGIGPVIGGFLISAFGWSAVFYLNVPIVAICLAAIFAMVPESRDASAPKPDLMGVTLSTLGLVALTYGVIRAGEVGWTAQIALVSFAIAVLLLSAFGWWENHSSNPMVPLHFFKNLNFTGANLSLTIGSFAMMGSMYFYSQYLQSVEGYSPLIAALSMLPMSPVILLSTMVSVSVDRKLGSKATLCLGLLISGLALFLFSWFIDLSTPYGYILIVQTLQGIGIGFSMSPATNAVMGSLPPNRAGIGSAMNDTTRQLGGALGVAVLGASMNSIYRAGVGQLAGLSGITDQVLEQIRSGIQSAHNVALQLDTESANTVILVSSQAFVDGMREAMIIGSITMVIATIAIWTIMTGKTQTSEIGEASLAEES